MNTTYLSAADTAKLVRNALKRHFPTVRFSVRSHTYAGGASINVGWTDGPASQLVDGIVKQFAGGGFDASIDMAYHVDHWLLPDGSTVCARSPGTTGSMGYVEPVREWMPHPDAKLVSFGANYVFTNRKVSPFLVNRALESMRARGWPVECLKVEVSDYDGSGHIAIADYSHPEAASVERRAQQKLGGFMILTAAT